MAACRLVDGAGAAPPRARRGGPRPGGPGGDGGLLAVRGGKPGPGGPGAGLGDAGGSASGLPHFFRPLGRPRGLPRRPGGAGHPGGVLHPADLPVGEPRRHPLGHRGADGTAGSVGLPVRGTGQFGRKTAGIGPGIPLFPVENAASYLSALPAAPPVRRTAHRVRAGLEVRRRRRGALPPRARHRFPPPAGQVGVGNGGPVRLDPRHRDAVPGAGGAAPAGLERGGRPR